MKATTEYSQQQAKLDTDRQTLQARLDEAEKKTKEVQAKLDNTEKEKKEVQAKLDNTEKERREVQAKLDKTAATMIQDLEKKNRPLRL